MKLFFALILFLLIPFAGNSQSNTVPLLERQISVVCESTPIKTVLSMITEQTGIQFSYSTDAFKASQKVSLNVQKKPVRYVLNRIFQGAVRYKVKGKYIILQKIPVEVQAQQKAKEKIVEGYVFDSKSGETLPEASVYNKSLMASAVTDQYGYFRIELPSDDQSSDLQVSKAGYTNIVIPAKEDSLPSAGVEVEMRQTGDTIHQSITGFIADSIWGPTLPHWLIPRNILANVRNLGDTIFRKSQISIAPNVGTNNLLTGNVSNDVSLNLLVGYVQSVNKFEAGALINIDRMNMTGCQMAGIGNIVGNKTKGAQMAGVFNVVREAAGLQAAGILNSTLRMSGMQLAGIVNTAGTAEGLQGAGVINYSRENADLQAAGNVNYAKRVSMLQISGNLNVAHYAAWQISGSANIALDTAKVQIACTFNYARHYNDVQVAGLMNLGAKATTIQWSGLINIARKRAGSQVTSLLNVARRVDHVQIGLINLSDSCEGITLGLFNFVKYGYHKIEFYSDDAFYTNIAFRSGSKHLHTFFFGGYQPNRGADGLWTNGMGIGSSFGNMNKWLFDIDLSSQQIFNNKFKFDNHHITKLYLGFDKKMAKNVSLAVGATGNLFYSDQNSGNAPSIDDITRYSFRINSNNQWKTWIGWRIGLRFL